MPGTWNDLITEEPLIIGPRGAPIRSRFAPPERRLNAEEVRECLLKALRESKAQGVPGPSFDEMTSVTGRTIAVVQHHLMVLVRQGLVRNLPWKRYGAWEAV